MSAMDAGTPKRFLDTVVVEKRCRTCWNDLCGGQRYRLSSVEAVRNGLRTSIKTWFSCNTEEDDGLPTAICKYCYRKLQAADKLLAEFTTIKKEAKERY